MKLHTLCIADESTFHLVCYANSMSAQMRRRHQGLALSPIAHIGVLGTCVERTEERESSDKIDLEKCIEADRSGA